MSTLPRNYFRDKSIRDPLYGFIDLSEKETKLIDTIAFRRLQFIKQLSHAYVVYPSAIHTRFEHSLGAMFIADKICSELDIQGEPKEIVRTAALLHDLGHGPFSHLFEPILKKYNPHLDEIHEEISKIIIKEDEEINSHISKISDQVVALLEKNHPVNWESSGNALFSDIVSGGLDADKLDYLRRDSYHIGVAYGQFDLDRILHTIRRTPHKQTRICIDIKGKDALENYRLGRYLMHAQVYEHHARLVADQMFILALDIAINEENIIDKNLLKINPKSTNKDFMDFYLPLNDYSINELIIQNEKSKISKEILQNIKKRKLLKRACDFGPKSLESYADASQALMKKKPEDLKKIADEVAKKVGIQTHEIIFHKSKIDIKLYKEGEILFVDGDKVLDLTLSSPFSAKDSVIRFYVFGPEDKEIRKKIANEMASNLGVPEKTISYFEL